MKESSAVSYPPGHFSASWSFDIFHWTVSKTILETMSYDLVSWKFLNENSELSLIDEFTVSLYLVWLIILTIPFQWCRYRREFRRFEVYTSTPYFLSHKKINVVISKTFIFFGEGPHTPPPTPSTWESASTTLELHPRLFDILDQQLKYHMVLVTCVIYELVGFTMHVIILTYLPFHPFNFLSQLFFSF